MSHVRLFVCRISHVSVNGLTARPVLFTQIPKLVPECMIHDRLLIMSNIKIKLNILNYVLFTKLKLILSLTYKKSESQDPMKKYLSHWIISRFTFVAFTRFESFEWILWFHDSFISHSVNGRCSTLFGRDKDSLLYWSTDRCLSDMEVNLFYAFSESFCSVHINDSFC